MRILYVEDDARDADLTLRTMRKTAPDLRFETVSTIHEALERLERVSAEPLDLVLTDMRLHDGDGLSLLKYIRENDLPVAVVVITGVGDEETAVTALKTRADDYVVKHKDYLDHLPTTLESALNHYRADTAQQTRLHRTEERNRALLNAIPDLMFLLSRDGTFLDYHAPADDLLLVPPQQFLGLKMSEVLPPDLAVQFYKAFELASDKPTLLEYQMSLPDGDHYFEASIVTCEGDKLLTICRDISERRQAEEALRESERRLRLAQQAARVGTWEWNIQTGTSIWSDMIWELLGLELDEEPSSIETFARFIHPDDFEPVLSRVDHVIKHSEDFYDEFRIVPRNGPMLWLSWKGRVLRAADGRPERMLGVNIDITERKLAEESLKTALAEVQQLKDRLHEENIYLQEEIRGASDFGEIVGRSKVLKRVLHQAEQVAPLDTTVLILGDTGTGKELLAHAIHSRSPRQKHPLVKVNCGALPAPLIESELFGHEKGAFTGADTQRLGRFALANGGTLFLDEIGELPLELQAKLLRVLEQGEFEMVGSSRTLRVDVRLLAATNRNLSEAVARGTFRSDLFYRLSIFPITMPPLRERIEDIPILVAHLVEQVSTKLGKRIETIPQSTLRLLEDYDWPGNVRELRNVIERAVIVTQGPKLQLTEIFEPLTLANESQPLITQQDQDVEGETLEQSEYRLILRTLKKVHWRVEGPGGAAELLNVHASTLRSRMRKLGIVRPKVKASSNQPE
jgi:formate hydrogenlyase transcriptional activator